MDPNTITEVDVDSLEAVSIEEGIPPVTTTKEADAADAADADAKSDTSTSIESGGNSNKAAVTAADSNAADAKKRKRNIKIGLCVLTALAALGATFGGGFAGGRKYESKHGSNKISSSSASSFVDDDDYVFVKPFGDLQVPPLSEDVLQGFGSREEFDAAMTWYLKDIANVMIEYNVLWDHPHSQQMNDDGVNFMDDEIMSVINEFTEPPTGDDATASVAQDAAVGVSVASATHTTTLTNNQEADVDEGDVAKNDENYIYGAYGQYLVVLDRRNGTVVTKEKMLIKSPEEVAAEEGAMNGEMNTDDAVWFNGPSYPSFQTVQLTQDHVIVTYSYSSAFYDSRTGSPVETNGKMVVYTKPTPEDPRLTLVASQSIPGGQILDSRYLEATDSVHVTTVVEWMQPLQALDYWNIVNMNNGGDLSRARYVEQATAQAKKVIPEFVKKLGDLMMPNDAAVMLGVGSWFRAGASIDDPYSAQNIGATIVTAIRVQDLPTDATDPSTVIPTTTASLMVPNAQPLVYAADDSMVISASAYHIDAETGMGLESLLLTHIKIDPNTAAMSFVSVGTVAGRLSSKYGIDIQGNDLRLATVENMGPTDDAWETITERCGIDWTEDRCSSEEAWSSCANLFWAGCQNVEATGCPYVYSCADDEDTATNMGLSSTANHIVVMDISQPGEMKEIGRVRIGEINEVIFAARFGETFVYANTFDQADPFYAIDLQPGQPPVVLGSVKLDGFYNFIEPLNEEGTLLVALGQNATVDADGFMMAVGVMLTVFDVSVPSNPKVLDTVLLAQKGGQEVGSSALWEPKSIQHQDGILVIPLNSYNTGYQVSNGGQSDFDGFIVVDVGNAAEQGIKELFTVDHACNGQNCYYSCSGGLMSYRSFFFEDTVATMSTQLVVGSDVATGDTVWSTVVETDGDSMHGCW